SRAPRPTHGSGPRRSRISRARSRRRATSRTRACSRRSSRAFAPSDLLLTENGRVDDPLLAQPVGDLLDAFAEATPVPAGGSAAALAVAMGASLLAMTARISVGHWDEAASCAAQAETLRRRAAPLA